MLAAATEIPELAISEEESKLLLKASNDVARHYASGALNQKYVDWGHLMSVVGAVYGSRIMAYRFRMAANRARDVTPRQQPSAQPSPEVKPATDAAQAGLDMMAAMHAATSM